jgi:hypothetical protein
MEWTEQEQEQLRAEWQRRAEMCREARQREREAFMGVAMRVTLSVGVTLAVVGGMSSWLASALFSPKPPSAFEKKPLRQAQIHYSRSEETAA